MPRLARSRLTDSGVLVGWPGRHRWQPSSAVQALVVHRHIECVITCRQSCVVSRLLNTPVRIAPGFSYSQRKGSVVGIVCHDLIGSLDEHSPVGRQRGACRLMTVDHGHWDRGRHTTAHAQSITNTMVVGVRSVGDVAVLMRPVARLPPALPRRSRNQGASRTITSPLFALDKTESATACVCSVLAAPAGSGAVAGIGQHHDATTGLQSVERNVCRHSHGKLSASATSNQTRSDWQSSLKTAAHRSAR